MLIRNSITTTKKLLKKTIHTFKSLFSGGSYHRIPKNPLYNNQKIPFGSGMIKNTELDNFYNGFTDQWDTDHRKGKANKIKRKISPPPRQRPLMIKQGDQNERSYEYGGDYEKGWKEEGSKCNTESRREEVENKLKEIEKMDISNVEHVLDIEEVLHYYSRLTCPAYLDIVDKFFMDMYSEILRN